MRYEVRESALDPWAKLSIRKPTNLVFTIVHESIHTLQEGGQPRTLLEAAIHEGVCDFLAAKATGTAHSTPTYEYAQTHEAALWAEFSASMQSQEWGDWLYTAPSDPSRPPDLAYAIGAFICEAYWRTAPDKQAAVKTMLRSRNADEVLQASGYGPK